MTDRATVAYRWAWTLVDALASAGVGRVIASPGARSTPLTLAALRHPGLTTHMVVDERAAAFFALGAAKAEGRPAVVVATSGSAVANWLPAVVEADAARMPMILLSADRPPELHDCGANQTMEQTELFGRRVRAVHRLPPPEEEADWLVGLAGRIVATACGPLPGPVQVNVPFREPLVPGRTEPVLRRSPPRIVRAAPSAPPADAEVVARLSRGGRTTIVCGCEALDPTTIAAIDRLATRAGLPVLADVTSGVRLGATADLVLAHPDRVARRAAPADLVLRFGGQPISKAIGAWMGRGRPDGHVSVSATPRVSDPDGLASDLVFCDPAALCDLLEPAAPDHVWVDTLRALDRDAAAAAAATCAEETPFEGSILRRLIASLPASTALVLGNSLTVRSADWFGGRGRERLSVFCNRGLSGIDGTVATACGVAAAAGPTVVVSGDLAFLHDVGSLAVAVDLPLVVVVLDNDGGGIFDHLPQSGLDEFEQGWRTPTRFDAAAIAAGFGAAFVRVEATSAIGPVVTDALARGGATVVHVPLDRTFALKRGRSFLTDES